MSPDNTPDTTEVTSEMARRCPVCTTVFTVATATSRQVFCSPTCKETNRQNKPVQQTCPACQTEFTTTAGQRRIYCSDECRTTSRTSEDARENRTCPVCEGPFEALRTVRQIYCSPTCRKDAERRRDQARDEDRARRLGETPAPAPLPELPPQPKSVGRAASRQPALERDPLEPTATRNCPHCQQPVTIVALLATPEAARPSVPTAIPDIVPLRRTP
ncbi:hypothetical protein ACFV4E_15295 [Streptomyces hygroscopicus]|uniref:Endogenous inhibitor of DNA gyrase (YacG/DUF329 family) n=1 Tax=Streptomyces demainii TaxID=588122 RepID=A0ABT9KZX7_9ACTN|nr:MULTISPECIES: hypothetical protein [Streptomyces]MDN3061201.1 hypothetical protein [Streptomyces sp. SRF1]MDP9607885.1 endogenous inhibitor of DNA gyrase (YacG/DUF329 family) [Streptomyces demainii]MDP9612876.1 endogenous inhibitor of DNA gyrase (YacG/DUF329 family) [Streptomyces demainii]